jgi:hypothetical protein
MKRENWARQWAGKQAKNWRGLFKTREAIGSEVTEKQVRALMKIEQQIERNTQDGQELALEIYIRLIEPRLSEDLPNKTELEEIVKALKGLRVQYLQLRETPKGKPRLLATPQGSENRETLNTRYRELVGRVNNYENANGIDLV